MFILLFVRLSYVAAASLLLSQFGLSRRGSFQSIQDFLSRYYSILSTHSHLNTFAGFSLWSITKFRNAGETDPHPLKPSLHQVSPTSLKLELVVRACQGSVSVAEPFVLRTRFLLPADPSIFPATLVVVRDHIRDRARYCSICLREPPLSRRWRRPL